MYPFKPHHYDVILADGAKPSAALFHQLVNTANSLIAADGAASWSIAQGHTPDLTIGDMDSFHDATIPLKHVIDQESNDLEKVFLHAQENNLNNLIILGAFGLRADHFLTNIFVLKKYSHQLTMFFVDDDQIAFMCPPRKIVSIATHVNDYFSLFPLGHRVGPIRSQGVDYPLNEEFLSLHDRLGTLNKISECPVLVHCESSNLLITLPHHEDLRILVD